MTSTSSQDLPQPAAIDADGLGLQHAATLPAAERTARGAWFTPPHVADLVVAGAAALAPAGWRPRLIVDPAAGGGALLLAAARRWPGAALRGIEADEATAEVARRALALAGAQDVRIVAGDGLNPTVLAQLGGVGGADLVLANPPFLGQMLDATARSAERRAALRRWYGPAAAGYVDDAALFVLAAVTHLLAPGGVAAIILPEAILATEAAKRVRSAVSAVADVNLIWRDHTGVFPGVPTCAIGLRRRREDSDSVSRPSTLADPVGAGTWNQLLVEPNALLLQSPTLPTIGDVATATADFRDAYYLVARHVGEATDRATWDLSPAGEHESDLTERGTRAPVRIVPVGLIDPAHNRWGRASVRFAKTRYERPVAAGLPDDFLAARLGPKLLIATQTRVLECLVDEEGDLLPTTPAITLRSERLWHVGAALTSPVLTQVARQRHAGAARSRAALKLSAKQVLALPLPRGDSPAWDEAADTFRAAHDLPDDPVARRAQLERVGNLMTIAYEVDLPDELLQRWRTDLPCR